MKLKETNRYISAMQNAFSELDLLKYCSSFQRGKIETLRTIQNELYSIDAQTVIDEILFSFDDINDMPKCIQVYKDKLRPVIKAFGYGVIDVSCDQNNFYHKAIYEIYETGAISFDEINKILDLVQRITNRIDKLNGDLASYFNQQTAQQSQLEPEPEPQHQKKELIIDKTAIKGLYRFNRQNEDYIYEYLKKINETLKIQEKAKKGDFGAVCLILYNRKIINCQTYSMLIDSLAKYWGIEPPKDKHPNKYKVKADSLKQKYYILERDPY